MKFRFLKMQACGNDFLIYDGIQSQAPEFHRDEIRMVCDQHFGIGADGLIVLHPSRTADANWEFYNADASKAEMCGNAIRCAIRYIADRYSLSSEVVRLQTGPEKILKGRMLELDQVEVTLMPLVRDKIGYTESVVEVEGGVFQAYHVDTGVPHTVIEVKDIFSFPIDKIGAQIQKHPMFAKPGVNVTFFERVMARRIRSTTFERGLGRQTLACGTGAAAAAIIYSELYIEAVPISVICPGGELSVDISPVSQFLLLQGPAKYSFEVEIDTVAKGFELPQLFGQGHSKR